MAAPVLELSDDERTALEPMARSTSLPHRVVVQAKGLLLSSFTSADHLIDTIDEWTEHWKENPRPLIWHRSAEEILAKVRRGRAALATATKSAKHN